MNQPQAQWHGEMSDGALWAIEAPEYWNGTLVIEPDLRRRDVDNRIYGWLRDRGFASARLSRDVHAFDFPRTLDHLSALREEAVRRLGTPETTLIWGRSLGSFTTRLVVEQRSMQVDAALAVDGGGMGIRGPFQAGRDAKFVLATLSGPPEALESPSVLRELLEASQRTPEGRARLALAAAFRGTMGGTGEPAERLQTMLDGLVLDLSESHVLWARAKGFAGGDFTENVHYDYTRAFGDAPTSELVAEAYAAARCSLDEDLAAIAGAPRQEADAPASEWIRNHASVAGDLPVPLLAVKGTTDPMSVPGEDGAYANMVELAGTSQLYRGLHTGRRGHVAQAPLDFAIAFTIVLDRLKAERWEGLGADDIDERRRSLRARPSWTILTGRAPEDAQHSYVDYTTPVHPRYLQESEQGRISA